MVLLSLTACHESHDPTIIVDEIGVSVLTGSIKDQNGQQAPNGTTGFALSYGDPACAGPRQDSVAFSVQNSTYSATLSGGFGVKPLCVDIRIIPPMSSAVELLTRRFYLPFRVFSAKLDTVRIDLTLRLKVYEPVGQSILVGSISDDKGNAAPSATVGFAQSYADPSCTGPPQDTKSFAVSNGKYAVEVIGGTGVKPLCVDLRVKPPPTSGLDSLFVRAQLPFRSFTSTPDTIKMDLILKPVR
jgi:hypothetical protein